MGGTALALRYGHRSSVDLDLFFHERFEYERINEQLSLEFGKDFDYESGHKKIGIFCNIQNVKVDIVYFPHLPIADIVEQDNIRFYSSSDIAAMKILAILGRAQKKDFWDLYELLQHYTLNQLIEWHRQKYPSQMLAISIPNAVTYFAEADESETPVSYKGQTWELVKKGISRAVGDYLK